MNWWQITKNGRAKLQQPGLTATLIRGTSAALIIQTAGAGIAYLTQVLLARWMGVRDYGIYDYVMTLSTVLALLAGLGLSGTVLRFVPEYTVKQNWTLLRGLLIGSWWQTVVASFVTVAVAMVIVFWVDRTHDLSSLKTPLLLGLWLIPLLALLKLQLEMARSFRQISLAYAPFFVLYPLLLICTVFVWHQMQNRLTSVDTTIIAACILLVILLVQLRFLIQVLPSEINNIASAYIPRQWLLVSLPILFIDGSFIVLNQTDTLMIAAFRGTTDVGIYGAAFKTAGWVSFILVSVNAIAAPLFGSLYAQGDRQALQNLVSTIARWMFYPALMIAIGLFLFAEPVLHWFGPEFTVAKWSLAALALGQLVNVGTGSVGYLLMMTGRHNQCAFVFGCSALANVFLNLIGIPLLGILGAAIATALSMILWNVWLNTLVVKHLGVNPSILAALGKRE